MFRFQREKFGAILDNFNWFMHQFPAKKKTIKKIPGSKNQKVYLFYVFIMLEQIYYNQSNLDDEGKFITDTAKDNAVDEKKFLASIKYLVSGPSINQ